MQRPWILLNQAGEPAGGGTPAAPAQPATPLPAAATPSAATPPADDQNPPWLAARLERERRTALAELGIKDPAKAKEVLTAAEKAAQEAKSQGEKLGEANARLKELEEEREQHLETFKSIAESRLKGLTDKQREFVLKTAGDDPQNQIFVMDNAAEMWGAQAPASAQVTPAATPAPATPASGTAPPPTAPASTTISQPNHKEVHSGLLKTNPFAAANYALEHMADVFPEKRP